MKFIFAARRSLLMIAACSSLALSVGACGSKSHSSSAGSSAGGSSSASAGGSSSSGAPAGTKKCPSGDASAVINGKSKCLHAGQICSHKAAAIAAYPRYGFSCTQQGSTYRLKKA